MKRVILFTTMAIMLPFLAWAQGEQPAKEHKSLNLKQAVEHAIEYNKQLQVSQYDVALYKEKVREAISQGLPQINGNVTYSTNFGYKLDLMGGAPIKMEDQVNGVVSVSQLFFSGQWITGVQTAKIAERIAEQNAEISELDVKENVINTYHMVLVYTRISDILENNVRNMEQIYTHTRNMFEAGVVEQTDVDQIRITVGTLKNSLASVKRNIEVTNNLLRLQLGMDNTTELTLTDQLEGFLNEDDYVRLAVKQFEIENNAEYQLMNTQEELSKKMVGMQKWAYAPTLAGNYSYTYKIKKSGFDLSPKHAAGITLNIPLFSGLERKSKVEQSKIELEQVYLNKSLMEDQLNLSDSQYKYELKNATENFILQQDNVEVAQRVLDNMQNKYREGAVSSMDMTQANSNYLQAQSDYTNACLTLLQAKTKLERLYNIFPY